MRAVLGSLVLLIAGCAAPPPFQREAPPPVPPAEIPDAAGTAIARAAQSLIGSPYRYGGAGPDAFDCSGLVAYVHRQLGYSTPRTAAQQYASARPIPRADLQPGDLVFFRLSGGAVSHVGVYMGNGSVRACAAVGWPRPRSGPRRGVLPRPLRGRRAPLPSRRAHGARSGPPHLQHLSLIAEQPRTRSQGLAHQTANSSNEIAPS